MKPSTDAALERIPKTQQPNDGAGELEKGTFSALCWCRMSNRRERMSEGDARWRGEDEIEACR